VLFLDEPTTGLDPASRNIIWDRIRQLRSEFGLTVFLTTQYLEEADQLADRVAIIDAGHIVREGAPAALKAEVGTDVIDITLSQHDRAAAQIAIKDLQTSGKLPAGKVHRTEAGCILLVTNGPSHIAALVRGLDRAGITPGPCTVSQPTLDDVFFAATGNRMAATAKRSPEQEELRTAEVGGPHNHSHR
jgi:ABC-2 type transport system ATP-binding protein